MVKKLAVLTLVLAFLLLPSVVLAANTTSQANSVATIPTYQIPADGSSTANITFTLKDGGGTPVQGDVINLSASNDGTANFPKNNQTTDSNGNASFTMTSTTAGTDWENINITDPNNTSNNTTFSNFFSITFYSVANGCPNVPAAPALISAVSNSDNTATLTWVDSANPVKNYLISYGTFSGKYIYGNPNVGGQGTTSYTVGSLVSGKTYYFVVAASNVCGASGFSNEMSVTVGPTPAPTIEPTEAPLAMTIDTLSDTPTDMPAEVVDTSTPASAVQNGSSAIKNIAIALLASGVVILGAVLIGIKIKSKKNPPIPPIFPPTTPPVLPPTTPSTIPPSGESPLV